MKNLEKNNPMKFLSSEKWFLDKKTVLVRADLNLPILKNRVQDPFRLRSILPTLNFLVSKNAKIILMSHLGRPKGHPNPDCSLKHIIETFQKEAPHLKINFCPYVVGENAYHMIQNTPFGQIVLLENLRFHPGEEASDLLFAKELACFGDFYVNDALSMCHRNHASITRLPAFLPAAAGLFLEKEIFALNQALHRPAVPVMAIVGGAKISTKLGILRHLLKKVDVMAVGGAMATTFLKSQGLFVGDSLVEDHFLETAKAIQKEAQLHGCTLLLPKDVIVSYAANVRCSLVEQISPQERICDIGPETLHTWSYFLNQAKTVVWNGPMGLFEIPPFHEGTVQLAQRIGERTKHHNLCSVAGGGDTLAALKHAHCLEDMSYASSAGGAFLEWLEGRELPGLQALESACS